MPYSHPYKSNSSDNGNPQQSHASESGNPKYARDFQNRAEAWAHRKDHRTSNLNDPMDHFVDRVVDIGTNVGAGVMDVLSDALSSAGDAISRWANRDRELTFPEWRARMDRKIQNGAQGSNLAMAIVGGFFACSFGISALVMFILSAVGPGALHLSDMQFMVFPILMAVFTPLAVGFAFMTVFGIRGYWYYGRLRAYLRAAHDWVCRLPAIARATGHSEAQIRRELTKAIADGKLPDTFLSEDGQTVFFKEELYRAEHAQSSHQEEQSRQEQEPPKPLGPMEEFLKEGQEFLLYLKDCKGRLDPTVDEELEEMDKNCAVILGFVHNHPEQLNRVRRFSEYYLPTTRKLLDTAQGLGTVDGENAQTIRRDITGILHTLNSAYAKLYDTLLQDVSLDVSTEIDTLETMLRQDGLTGGFANDFGASVSR